MTDLKTPVAIAVRRRKFERNRLSKAFDPDVPLTAGELDDAQAAIDAVVWFMAETMRNGLEDVLLQAYRRYPEHVWRTMVDDVLAYIAEQSNSSGQDIAAVKQPPHDTPLYAMSIDELNAEIAKWQAKIDSATKWSAAVGAAAEFRDEAQRELWRREAADFEASKVAQ